MGDGIIQTIDATGEIFMAADYDTAAQIPYVWKLTPDGAPIWTRRLVNANRHIYDMQLSIEDQTNLYVLTQHRLTTDA